MDFAVVLYMYFDGRLFVVVSTCVVDFSFQHLDFKLVCKVMYYIPRGGNRGGADQFEWSSVKTDKDREYYLGHSLKAPVGRWQDGRDLQWFNKSRSDGENTVSDERQAVRQAEKEAMMAALGQKVVRSPPRVATSGQISVNQAVPSSSRMGIEGMSKKPTKRSLDLKKKKKHKKEKSKKSKKKKSRKPRRHRHDSSSDTSSDSSSEESSSDSSSSSDSEQETVKHRRKHSHHSADGDDAERCTTKRHEISRDVRRSKHHKEAESDGSSNKRREPDDRNSTRHSHRSSEKAHNRGRDRTILESSSVKRHTSDTTHRDKRYVDSSYKHSKRDGHSPLHR